MSDVVPFVSRFSEWELGKKSVAELAALNGAFEGCDNPGILTKRLREAVRFRPRSNAKRCKDNFWFGLSYIAANWREQLKCPHWFFSEKISERNWDTKGGDYIFASQTEVDMLALASAWCDFDFIDPVVDVIFSQDKRQWLRMPVDDRIFNPPLAIPSLKWIHKLTMSEEFDDYSQKFLEHIPREAYAANDDDTGTTTIEALKRQIASPLETPSDVLKLEARLSKREARRLAAFGF